MRNAVLQTVCSTVPKGVGVGSTGYVYTFAFLPQTLIQKENRHVSVSLCANAIREERAEMGK